MSPAMNDELSIVFERISKRGPSLDEKAPESKKEILDPTAGRKPTRPVAFRPKGEKKPSLPHPTPPQEDAESNARLQDFVARMKARKDKEEASRKTTQIIEAHRMEAPQKKVATKRSRGPTGPPTKRFRSNSVPEAPPRAPLPKRTTKSHS